MDDENTFQEQLVVYTGGQGVPGPQGNFGTQGFQGLDGQGMPGLQGLAGLDGFQGGLGFQGIQGIEGLGLPGVQGSQGIQGDLGFGAQGVQGFVGAQGNDGTSGSFGFQGNLGFQGLQGSASGGTFTFGSNVINFTTGLATITHNLGSTPTTVLLTNGDTNAGPETMGVSATNSTTITVRANNPSGSSGLRRVNWMAIK